LHGVGCVFLSFNFRRVSGPGNRDSRPAPAAKFPIQSRFTNAKTNINTNPNPSR